MRAVLRLRFAHGSEDGVAGAGQALSGVAAEATAGTSDQNCLGHVRVPVDRGFRGHAAWTRFGSLRARKSLDDCRDLRSLAFERKMTGIEQMDFCGRIVAPEGLSAGRQEERIVFAPHGKKRGQPSADVLLELGIQREVALVVAKQNELDLVVSGSGEERGIKSPRIG